MELSCVVEMKEVGAVGGVSIETAAWHAPAAKLGDLIAIKRAGSLHSLAWRWLSEAYPGLCEANY
jgi:hypothetical protein